MPFNDPLRLLASLSVIAAAVAASVAPAFAGDPRGKKLFVLVGRVRGGRLASVGTTCAVCHSSIDDSVAPGVGQCLDGWPDLDLNLGAIIALSAALFDV